MVWTAVNFRTKTSEPSKVTGPGMPPSGLRDVDRVAAFGGGLMVRATATLLDGIGISGPRRRDADEA